MQHGDANLGTRPPEASTPTNTDALQSLLLGPAQSEAPDASNSSAGSDAPASGSTGPFALPVIKAAFTEKVRGSQSDAKEAQSDTEEDSGDEEVEEMIENPGDTARLDNPRWFWEEFTRDCLVDLEFIRGNLKKVGLSREETRELQETGPQTEGDMMCVWDVAYIQQGQDQAMYHSYRGTEGYRQMQGWVTKYFPKWKEARLEKEWRACKEQWGETDLKTLNCLDHLVVCCSEQEHADKAVALCEGARATHEQAQEPRDSVEIVRILNRLGTLYSDQGKDEPAAEVLKQAYAIGLRSGPDHPATLLAQNNLAELHSKHGRNGSAVELYEQARAAHKGSLVGDSVEMLHMLNNLGDLYSMQEHYDQAREVLEHAYNVCQKLASDHPETLRTKNNLAVLYSDQGKDNQAEELYAKAEKLYREVLTVSKNSQQLGDSATLDTLANLARLYHRWRKYARAENLYNQVLTARKEILGEDHSDTLLIVEDLAEFFVDQGKYAQAQEQYNQVLAVLEADHPAIVKIRQRLAEIAVQQQQ